MRAIAVGASENSSTAAVNWRYPGFVAERGPPFTLSRAPSPFATRLHLQLETARTPETHRPTVCHGLEGGRTSSTRLGSLLLGAGDERLAVDVVLVHGGWHGSWCKARVVSLLERRGASVPRIDLLSIDADPDDRAALSVDAAAVVHLPDLREPALLCGQRPAAAPYLLAERAGA